MNQYDIHFFYPSGSMLTGQELASKIIINLLGNDNSYKFNAATLPAFCHGHPRTIKTYIRYITNLCKSWKRFLILAFADSGIIYLNLGQSLKSMMCDGIPYLIVVMLNPKLNSVVSLHGNNFMAWTRTEFKTRLLLYILCRATIITALGNVQAKHLSHLSNNRIDAVLVDNTCDIELEIPAQVKSEHEKVNILYLSNLIQSKGYDRFLEAMEIVSLTPDTMDDITAVLCGDFYRKFRGNKCNLDEPAWVSEMVRRVNQSGRVKLHWVIGAYGEQKAALFRNADIFVFPSAYKTEAQPIVLIEAMAAGCAIIASDVGEIPYMLRDGAGICISDCSPQNIAEHILDLIRHPEKMLSLRTAARARYQSQFSREKYAMTWRYIFNRLAKSSST